MLIRRRSILKAALGVVAGALLSGAARIVPAGRRPEVLRAGPAAIRKWDDVYIDKDGRVRGALAASDGIRVGVAISDVDANGCVDVALDSRYLAEAVEPLRRSYGVLFPQNIRAIVNVGD